jgi:hypothetical protein
MKSLGPLYLGADVEYNSERRLSRETSAVRVRVAVILGMLALPLTAGSAFAAAGSTAANGYGGESNVASQAAGTAAAGAAQGALPFTGLDLALIAFVGALLLTVGLFIRRRAAQRAD